MKVAIQGTCSQNGQEENTTAGMEMDTSREEEMRTT